MPAILDCVPDVRAGQILDYEQLRAGAEEAWRESGKTQREVAEDHGEITHSAVSRAVNEAGPNFAKLQSWMIERYKGYRVVREETVRFRLRRG